jgi:hypothetical protein
MTKVENFYKLSAVVGNFPENFFIVVLFSLEWKVKPEEASSDVVSRR